MMKGVFKIFLEGSAFLHFVTLEIQSLFIESSISFPLRASTFLFFFLAFFSLFLWDSSGILSANKTTGAFFTLQCSQNILAFYGNVPDVLKCVFIARSLS